MLNRLFIFDPFIIIRYRIAVINRIITAFPAPAAHSVDIEIADRNTSVLIGTQKQRRITAFRLRAKRDHIF